MEYRGFDVRRTKNGGLSLRRKSDGADFYISCPPDALLTDDEARRIIDRVLEGSDV